MAIIINESDIGKTEIQLLMDLIYESAGIRVPQQKIVYGKPQEMDFRPDVADDPNTFIPVVIDQDYDDRFTPTSNNGLLYRRRDIATHFILPSYDIYTQESYVQLYDILPQINLLLSYPLSQADIEDQTLSIAGLTNIVIKTNPESYIWIGSVDVSVNIHTGDKLLMLSDTDLEGF